MPNFDLRVRVLVADAVPMSCHLLADALGRNNQLDPVSAISPLEVREALKKSRFDVLLVSATLGQSPMESLQFVREVRTLYPRLGIVVLLDSAEKELIVEAFRGGAAGVFLRSDSLEALSKCVLCVHQGQVWASSNQLLLLLDVLAQPVRLETGNGSGTRPLSKREEEIAQLVAAGYSNRQISQRLDLSEHTIKNYLFRVFEKLGVSTRVELTLYALKKGKVSQSRPRSTKRVLTAERPFPESSAG